MISGERAKGVVGSGEATSASFVAEGRSSGAGKEECVGVLRKEGRGPERKLGEEEEEEGRGIGRDVMEGRERCGARSPSHVGP